jgi:phosphohistidine phosphatase
MDRLILLRHGKAEGWAASGRDFDRSLNERGRRESAAVGRRLAEAGLIPDVVLISPSARTRQTWDQLAASFPKARPEFQDGLYNADTAELRRVSELAGRSARTVMVVGHNPGLQDLMVGMLRDGGAAAGLVDRAESQFPTAAAAVFLIDDAGRPVYDGFFLPEPLDAD